MTNTSPARKNSAPTGAEKQRLTKRHTINPEAYQAYLKGRYFWNKYSEEGVEKAFTWFRQALQFDPGYALAQAGLADCYNWRGIWGVALPKEAFTKARDAARAALHLDDTLAEAHTSLAFAEWTADWNWAKAAARFKHAVELNPSYSNAWRWYSTVFGAQGKFDESLKLLERAREIDPVSPLVNLTMWQQFYCARRQARCSASSLNCSADTDAFGYGRRGSRLQLPSKPALLHRVDSWPVF